MLVCATGLGILLRGCGLFVFCIIRVAQVDRGAANPAHLQSFRFEGSYSVGFVGLHPSDGCQGNKILTRVPAYCCLANAS